MDAPNRTDFVLAPAALMPNADEQLVENQRLVGSSTGWRSRGARAAGSVVGIVLFVAAAWVAWGQRGVVMQAYGDIGHASWLVVAALLLLPVVGWSLTALMYFFLMNRAGLAREGVRCGLREMHVLLGAAWMLNYAPARPGMFARIAYHVGVNRFAGAHVVAASFVAILCGGVALVLLSGVCWAAQAQHWSTPVVVAGLCAPAAVLALAAWWMRPGETQEQDSTALGKVRVPAWRLLAATGARYLDCLCWLARYACVFHVLRVELSPTQLAAITVISQASALVPFVGAGLGVREWAIGLLGPMLPTAGGTMLVKATGIAGDVINRAAEVLAAVAVGVPCMAILGAKLHAGKDTTRRTNAG
jgi:hypothetical protein